MRKIIFGLLSIFGLVAIVTGSAYALFSDTVQVSGITFSSGNADLKVDDDSDPAGAADSANLSGFTGLKNLYPGMTPVSATFYLQNKSASDIDLRVKARLTSATDWPNLADVVLVKVTHVGTGAHTGWKSLSEWNASEITLPNDLDLNEHAAYKVEVTVDSSADNTIANKTLSNVVFTLTGTQL